MNKGTRMIASNDFHGEECAFILRHDMTISRRVMKRIEKAVCVEGCRCGRTFYHDLSGNEYRIDINYNHDIVISGPLYREED